MGILEKLFGKKKEEIEEVPIRLQVQKREEDYTGQRWKLAKKLREQRELEEPIIKRKRF